MSVPPGATVAAPVLVMERSAIFVQSTVVETVALLLLLLSGSVDDVETEAGLEVMVELHVVVLGTV